MASSVFNTLAVYARSKCKALVRQRGKKMATSVNSGKAKAKKKAPAKKKAAPTAKSTPKKTKKAPANSTKKKAAATTATKENAKAKKAKSATTKKTKADNKVATNAGTKKTATSKEKTKAQKEAKSSAKAKTSAKKKPTKKQEVKQKTKTPLSSSSKVTKVKAKSSEEKGAKEATPKSKSAAPKQKANTSSGAATGNARKEESPSNKPSVPPTKKKKASETVKATASETAKKKVEKAIEAHKDAEETGVNAPSAVKQKAISAIKSAAVAKAAPKLSPMQEQIIAAKKAQAVTAVVVEPIEDRKTMNEQHQDDYMNPERLNHFKGLLRKWKIDLMQEVDRTVGHMKDDSANLPDPADRASQEEEFTFELRTRDRERKLIRKIDQAIDSIEAGEYGYCESCGIEIGYERLEARPTATLCIDCKTLAEIKEKQEKG
jgi:DnaK suppressor protein